ncbi:hypothetical protein WICMUC_003004 [Wickerhamomyces mucosus]|uniref:Small ribosomal subunit protein mS38 n=1 Tax=Wickerhamomyces mucosus TaxID=1378264 RepID=A0A9P8PMK9_9ASCO|nr:hypothetical protein WICMUC_003004 [Wickerhamomyces mucosus]
MFSLIKPQMRILTNQSIGLRSRLFSQLSGQSSIKSSSKLLPIIPSDTLSKLFQLQLNLNSNSITPFDPLTKIPSIANFHNLNSNNRRSMNDPLRELTAFVDDLENEGMLMDSVLRKRKLKMKKHKLRKRRKAQRALRRKLKKD